jgi:hypothetical protein
MYIKMSTNEKQNNYEIKFTQIDKITAIKNKIDSMDNEKMHYRWNDVDFMYKKNIGATKLVVVFHGAVNVDTSLPVFRGFDYTLSKCNILSISDSLLIYYKSVKMLLTWYLSTKKYNMIERYETIIRTIMDSSKNNDNVLFYGTSGGAYASIYFASIFNQSCLVSNGQIYLQKYTYWDRMNYNLKKCNDEIIYPDLHEHIITNGFPKRIYMYYNKNDIAMYHDHALPFNRWIEDKNIPIYCTVYFIGQQPTHKGGHHAVNYPEAVNYKKLLNEL